MLDQRVAVRVPRRLDDEPEGAAALDAELAKREAFLRGRKVFDLACGLNS